MQFYYVIIGTILFNFNFNSLPLYSLASSTKIEKKLCSFLSTVLFAFPKYRGPRSTQDQVMPRLQVLFQLSSQAHTCSCVRDPLDLQLGLLIFSFDIWVCSPAYN